MEESVLKAYLKRLLLYNLESAKSQRKFRVMFCEYEVECDLPAVEGTVLLTGRTRKQTTSNAAKINVMRPVCTVTVEKFRENLKERFR